MWRVAAEPLPAGHQEYSFKVLGDQPLSFPSALFYAPGTRATLSPPWTMLASRGVEGSEGGVGDRERSEVRGGVKRALEHRLLRSVYPHPHSHHTNRILE